MAAKQSTATEIPMNSLVLVIEKNAMATMTCMIGVSRRSKTPILITVAAGICSNVTSGLISLIPDMMKRIVRPITTRAREVAIPRLKPRLTQLFKRLSSYSIFFIIYLPCNFYIILAVLRNISIATMNRKTPNMRLSKTPLTLRVNSTPSLEPMTVPMSSGATI